MHMTYFLQINTKDFFKENNRSLTVHIMTLNGCRLVDSWKTTHSDSDSNWYDPSG